MHSEATPVTAGITLVVNGTEHRLSVDTRATLLDMLRERPRPDRREEGLRPRAVRRLHGAGRRAPRERLPRAGRRPRRRRDHHRRGAGRRRQLAPLQAAFIEHDAFQCGYCTPGQLCSAVGDAGRGRAGLAERASPRTCATSPGLDDAEIRERMSGNLCRCGAYASIVARDRGQVARDVRPFDYERAADAPRRRSPRARASRRHVPRRRHEPRRPDAARRRDARACSWTSRGSPHDRDRGDARTAALRDRRGACATATSPPTARCASATRCWRRRCSRAPRARCATWPRSAATCCSAPAAPTSRTSPSRATSASPGSGCPARDGDHRNLAILGHSRRCVATHPSDMAVALAALGASVQWTGRTGSGPCRCPGCHRLPGDEPERDTVLEPRRPDHRGRGAAACRAARPRYRKVRDRASFAFARGVGGGGARRARRVGAGLPARAGRRRPRAVAGRAAPRRRCAARRPPGRIRRAPPTPSWPARPLRDNGYKVPLARNLTRPHASYRSCAGGIMTTAAMPHVGDDRPIEGAREGHRPGPVRLRATRWTSPTPYRPGRRSPAARSASIDADAVLQLPGRDRRLWHGERAPAGHAGRTPSWPCCSPRRSPTAASSSPLVVAETLGARGRRPRLLRVEYDAEPHDVELRIDHPGLYRPDQVNPVCPPTPSRATRTPRSPPPRRARGRDVQHPGGAQQPDGAARHRRHVGRRRADALRLQPGRVGASRDTLAPLFGLPPEHVRVISPHVGGGFGSKATPRPHSVLAALAAEQVGRPVKLAVTRQQMFAVDRLPHPDDPAGTARRRRRRAADRDRARRRRAELHGPRVRRADHHAHPDDVRRAATAAPRTGWSGSTSRRRPACARPARRPGMFALESAMDELAVAAGIDPVELRIRNEPAADPESGLPFSSPQPGGLPARGRRAVRLGRPRPGAAGRAAAGRWLIGTGVAAATYPACRVAPRRARRGAEPDGDVHRPDRRRRHRHRRPDGAHPDRRRHARAPTGPGRGWRSATARCRSARGGRVDRDRLVGHGRGPGLRGAGRAARPAVRRGARRRASRRPPTPPRRSARSERFARHAFGAQFAEVAVDADTGEIAGPPAARRVRRRADRQPEDRPLAVRRRHDHGPVDGAAGGERHGRASSATSSTTTSPSTTSPACADVRDDRRGLGRGGRPAPQPDGRQGHRRDRHRRHRRGGRPTPSTTPPASASATCRSPSDRLLRCCDFRLGSLVR